MSGIEPISAALNDAALMLGFPLEILQADLFAGDVLAATVLPPQNGHDLIEILGQQVAAQLPPTVRPGEVLLLRVTGFAGNQVLVENLGLADPQTANAAQLQASSIPGDSAPMQTATLTTVRPAAPQPVQTPPSPAGAASNAAPAPSRGPSVAPPASVFVAASVRSAEPARAAAEALAQAIPARDADPLEARIAAAQTAKTAAVPQSPAAPSRPPVAPGALSARVQTAVQAAVRSAADAVSRTIRTAGDAIRALRLPDTPVVRTAAAIAPQAAARMPAVLGRLEAALPRESADPRIATLRTLIAFVGRMNPQNEETLGSQLSAYVSHVLEGGESKLTQLLQAADESAQAAEPSPHPEKAGSHPAAVQPMQTAAQARVAERSAAIDHDLKSLVLSLLRNPEPQRTPALSQALNETLITLTGAQIDALANSSPDTGSYAFAVPVFFHEGGKPAHLHVSREGANGTRPLDAENFHVAFVLDTAHLGTVAIDLQAIGRAVTVDVETERPGAASQFSQTLNSLRSRLEGLHYRVSSAVAGVALRNPPAAEVPARNIAAAPPAPGVDLHA